MQEISSITNQEAQVNPPQLQMQEHIPEENNEEEAQREQQGTSKKKEEHIELEEIQHTDQKQEAGQKQEIVDAVQQPEENNESETQNAQIFTANHGKLADRLISQKLSERVLLERQLTNKGQSEYIQKKSSKKTLKPKKNLGIDKRQIQPSFDGLLKQVLKSNKLIKKIFNHFCKENNLTCIKSSLFDDKQKKMQEMSLNKWMVFCKELQIFQKLCKIKAIGRKTTTNPQQLYLQTSQARQFYRIKEAKQVEKKLMIIFRNSNKNASRMNFQAFFGAICQIYGEFKQFYAQQQSGISEFLCNVMFCSDQKSCFNKLSHLKFTSTTPQIQYNKISVPQGTVKSRVKSKAVLTNIKENITSDFYTLEAVNNKKSRNFTKLKLNPILIEAKKSIKQSSTYSKGGKKVQQSLTKLNLKENVKPKQQQQGNDLIQYFQSTDDPILNSFFIMQGRKRMQTEIKQ